MNIKSFSKEELIEILNQRLQGDSLQTVADRYGVSRLTIRHLESKLLKGENND